MHTKFLIATVKQYLEEFPYGYTEGTLKISHVLEKQGVYSDEGIYVEFEDSEGRTCAYGLSFKNNEE